MLSDEHHLQEASSDKCRMFCVEQVDIYKKGHLINVGWFVLSRSTFTRRVT